MTQPAEIFDVRTPRTVGELALYPFRRLARRLLRPWLLALADRLRALDATLAALRDQVGSLNDQNETVDRLTRVESELQRVDDDMASLRALGWDHVAVVNRLSQLEDRLIDDSSADIAPNM
jgi:hypothetical protein